MIQSKREAESLLDKGISFAEKGHHRDAISLFKQAISIEPRNGVFRFNLGLSYMRIDELQKAIEEFILSIRYSPYYSDSYFSLAACYLLLGPDWKAAVYYLAYLDFSRFGKKAKEAKKRLSEMGRDALIIDVKDWIKAAEDKYNDFIHDMGLTGIKLGEKVTPKESDNREEILGGLQSWLTDVAPSKAKEWAGPHFENSIKLAGKGKLRAGIAQLITGLDIYPHDHPARCTLARIYVALGEHKQASEILNFVDVEGDDPVIKSILSSEIEEIRSIIRAQ